MYSTAADLLRWDQALYTDTPLTAASRARMFTRHMLTDIGPDAYYGYGWGLYHVRGHTMVTHVGGAPGSASYVVRLIDDHITVILVSNLETVDTFLLRQTMNDIIFGTR